jgi:hypothetical protein
MPDYSRECDEARVRQTVLAYSVNIDLCNFTALEMLFTNPFVVDYTSLWGGDPQTLTPAEFMRQMKGIAPGFDATWHELIGIEVHVYGMSAAATCGVDGRHWIDDRIWHPIGRYDFSLVKSAGKWKITSVILKMSQELGSREVAEEAMRRMGNAAEGGWIGPGST